MSPSLRTTFTWAALAALPLASCQRTTGFIGCSMAENVATGYVAVGGQTLWAPYGTSGAVVQSWTDTNSTSWQKFDGVAKQNGLPDTVWVQICIFERAGATTHEVAHMVANARAHAAPGARILISGQPLYSNGETCFLAGPGGPEWTDNLARQVATDALLNVEYIGTFWLGDGEVSDTCHANAEGEQSLGRQALRFFG